MGRAKKESNSQFSMFDASMPDGAENLSFPLNLKGVRRRILHSSGKPFLAIGKGGVVDAEYEILEMSDGDFKIFVLSDGTVRQMPQVLYVWIRDALHYNTVKSVYPA